MRGSNYIIFGIIALMLNCAAAWAFKEETSNSVLPDDSRKQGASKNSSELGAGIKLKPATTEMTRSKDQKVGIQIPGSGFLGNFPTFNFGLELLYGANQDVHREEQYSDDGFIMKGAVKKKF
ncbi:MAG: hypothetical protein ACRBBN_08625 [Methyloligellaceae bacterium]